MGKQSKGGVRDPKSLQNAVVGRCMLYFVQFVRRRRTSFSGRS